MTTEKYDLDHWFKNQTKGTHILYDNKDGSKSIQLWGFEVILLKDGTYILNDTSGG